MNDYWEKEGGKGGMPKFNTIDRVLEEIEQGRNGVVVVGE